MLDTQFNCKTCSDFSKLTLEDFDDEHRMSQELDPIYLKPGQVRFALPALLCLAFPASTICSLL